MAKAIQSPAFDFQDTARWYLGDVLRQLKINTETQCIYPKEIYSGFRAINAARAARGQWHAEGEGVNSFQGRIVNSTPKDGRMSSPITTICVSLIWVWVLAPSITT